MKTERQIDAKAAEASRWAVIPLKALDPSYKPTMYEERAIRSYARAFTAGSRWAVDLP